MLINWHDPDHVYLVCGKTDLRKGIDGLAMVIAENYGLELYDNSCQGRFKIVGECKIFCVNF